MDATQDYAAAARMLHATLPAYVAYEQHTHIKVGPVDKTDTELIVVRTSDGKVIRGKTATIQTDSGSHTIHGDIVTHQIFLPACYQPGTATIATYNERPAEAIALHNTCDKDDGNDAFSMLYLDPRTHEPLGVTGDHHDDSIDFTIEERFAHTDGRFMPGLLDVHVAGKGWLGWLQVLAHVEFSRFRFLDNPPST